LTETAKLSVTPARRETDDNLKSLSKIIRILECFSINDRALSLADICQRTGLPKSTTHRFLASMRDVGFLDQDRERDRYRLGLRLFEFGNVVLSNMDLHREARPFVDNLQRITGQTIHLAVFDGLRAVVIHRADSTSDNGLASSLIENAPAHCTSVGKAILAFQAEDTVQRVIDAGLTYFTEQTITDPAKLRKTLQEIRDRGYSVDDEEHQPGLRCVGAPIRDQTGRVFAGASVSGPAWQISMADVPDLAKIVTYQTNLISQRLGWHQ
jgi:DNA-binding IclR family transcriptional regulator